jgi:hypothetical protein
MVAENAAQLEKVGALAEVERGEGGAELVKAGPGGADLLYERLEDAAAEVAGISVGIETQLAETEAALSG